MLAPNGNEYVFQATREKKERRNWKSKPVIKLNMLGGLKGSWSGMNSNNVINGCS